MKKKKVSFLSRPKRARAELLTSVLGSFRSSIAATLFAYFFWLNSTDMVWRMASVRST